MSKYQSLVWKTALLILFIIAWIAISDRVNRVPENPPEVKVIPSLTISKTPDHQQTPGTVAQYQVTITRPTPSPTSNSLPHGKVLLAYSYRPGNYKGKSFMIVTNLDRSNHVEIQPVFSDYSWSPDGHWIAAVSNKNIWLIKADGSKITQLTDSLYPKSGLSWSPTRDQEGQILFSAFVEESMQWDFFLVNVHNGKAIQRLTNTPGDERDGSWSPDGLQIVFSYEDPSDEVYQGHLTIMDVDGKNRRIVTDIPTHQGGTSWSPDGSRIAFLSGSRPTLYVVNIDGSGPKKMLEASLTSQWHPAWFPDSSHIVYIDQKENLFILNTDGSPFVIFTGAGISSFAISPVPVFLIGGTYQVTDAGNGLNLHEEALLDGKIIKRLSAGDVFRILAGPIDFDDYYWWRIRLADGSEGWIVDVAGWTKKINP